MKAKNLTSADKVLFQLSSVVEYLLDRGDIEDIEAVSSNPVRYGPRIPVKHVDFACDGKIVRVTAEIVGTYKRKDLEK